MKTSSQLEIIMQVFNFLSETECVCYKIPECPVLSYIVGGWVLKSNAICVPTLGHCEF